MLAGGTSRRMGRDKLPLDVGGEALISRACKPLLATCEEILLVGQDAQAPPSLPPGVRAVRDERPGRLGPLAGMEAGLRAARNPAVFVVAGDMPFVPERLVRFAFDTLAASGAQAVVPLHAGRLHPLCAAYSRAVLAHATLALDAGRAAVRDFVSSLGGVVYLEGELERFGDPDVFLMSVNTREDLLRARAVVAGVGGGMER